MFQDILKNNLKVNGVRTAILPNHLGGGSYLIKNNNSNNQVRAGTKESYGGIAPKTGFQRNHVIPFSIGGSNESSNIQYQPVDLASISDTREKTQARDLKSGKLSRIQALENTINTNVYGNSTGTPKTSFTDILKGLFSKSNIKQTTQGIGGVINKIIPTDVKERFSAYNSAIKGNPEPLKQSFKKQAQEFADQNIPNKNDTPKQKQAKLVNSILSFTGETGGFNPEKYVEEQTAKQAETKGSSFAQKITSFLKDAKAKLVDSSAPIEDVLTNAEKKGKFKILPENDIRFQIDRVLKAPTIAGQFAKDNGLVELIKKVPDINVLDQYLIAKHAQELESRGIQSGRDLIRDRQLISAVAPKYEQFAQQVKQYSQKLLDYSVKSGLISKELSFKLKELYPNYVPFNRIFSEIEKNPNFGGKALASLSSQTIVQKIQGSTKEIESPIQSLLAKTNDAFKQGEKNIAARQLASYEKLPNNPFQLRKLKAGESAAHTISYLDNGVKKTFETTPEIANAAKSLNVQQLNILGKIFAVPVRLARLGITGLNIPFVASNIAKDQVTAFINSDRALSTSLANPKNFMKSLFAAIGHGDLYQEVVRSGGAGTSFDLARNQVENTVAKIRAGKSVGSSIKYKITHPSELLRAAENIISRSEELTRIQQYQGTKSALIKQGVPEFRANILAAKQASENTVNFSRHGEWGTVLNSAFLYLNAGIQGTRTLVRNLITKPLATTVKLATAVFLPVTIATAWNLSDPKRKAAYEDIPDFEKQNNIIIIPPNPIQDKDGKWNIIKIPLSQEINNISNIPRRYIEQTFHLDPVKGGELANALIGTISPINPSPGSISSTLTPQAFKPSLEEMSNTNFFTGGKIVPDNLSKASPNLQVKPNTPKLAKKIGGLLNISPLKVESFVKETAGGVGAQLLGSQGILSSTTARFNKAQGGAIAEKQYQIQQKAGQAAIDKQIAIREQMKPIFKLIQSYKQNKNTASANALYNKLTFAQKKEYKNLLTAFKAQATKNKKLLIRQKNKNTK